MNAIDARQLSRRELIGLKVRVTSHPDPSVAGAEGVVVDETLNTLSLECRGKSRRLQKRGGTFEFLVGDQAVRVEGKDIAFRPEDRTKKAG